MSEHLFVYGTLLAGAVPPAIEPLARQLQAVGRGRARGRLYDVGPYPAALFDPSADSFVWGNVCRLPADAGVLAALDAYEGYLPANPAASLYLRVRQVIELCDGRSLECWAYQYQRELPAATLIPSGDYLAWRRGRP